MRARVAFVVESGTDVRLIEGLAERFALSAVLRPISGGSAISRAPRCSFEVVEGPESRLGFARFAFSYLRRAQPDVTLVQGYGTAALAAHLARPSRNIFMLVCSPVEDYYVCRREHPDPGRPYRVWELAGQRALARLNARFGANYVVLSEHLAGVVRAHGARHVAVVPVYGVDTGIFRPSSESRAELRRRRGLPATGSIIFFSSRIAPEKDTETLLGAFARLLAQGFDVWLLNRSGGHARLIEAARAAGVANRLVATDAVHPHGELPLDYQAADLCVQASREEGLGFSPLEALACEVPVVAAATGGLLETIRDGETGWTYPVGDAAALARAMAEALHDPAEAARRARTGRALVLARFDRKLVFDRLEQVLLG
ncbi:MAG TPA: glycosyltransferase [Planctomycetota bacterium]|nr:glycosyltransferase [Planctomycetota bacterium]